MAIEKHEVKTFKIDFKCDVCGKGYFRPTGIVYPTNPAQYPHKCTVCGAATNIVGHTFPYTVTEEVDSGEFDSKEKEGD